MVTNPPGQPGEPPRRGWRLAGAIAAAYAVWLLAAVAGMAVLFAVWLPALLKLYTFVGLLMRWRGAVWVYPAFSNAVVLAFALTWLVLVVLGEAWFRAGASQGGLLRRAKWVVLVEGAVGGLGYLVLRLLS